MSLILQLQAAEQCKMATIEAMCHEGGCALSFVGYEDDLMSIVFRAYGIDE